MDQEWYQNFVSDENMNQDMLFELITAANFLGIPPLLNLTCLKVTFLIPGKNEEEVRYVCARSLTGCDLQFLTMLCFS